MPDGRESELGVRFVHGVGEQKREDTLIRCADPLKVGSLYRRLDRERYRRSGAPVSG